MLKKQILDYVLQRQGNVSFAELAHIDGFEGEYAWGLKDTNIFFWFSLSEDAVDAMRSLLQETMIALVPTSALVYIVDGCVPTAPIARSARAYKKPRWAPVTIDLGSAAAQLVGAH